MAGEIGEGIGLGEAGPVAEPKRGRGRPRKLFSGGSGGGKGRTEKRKGTAGKGAGPTDTGTADPAEIAALRAAKRPASTSDQRAARRAAEKEKAKLAVTRDPPAELPTEVKEQIAGALAFVHVLLAAAASYPGLELSTPSLDAYSSALTNYMRWHMPGFNPDGKRGSELALLFVMLMIYGPMIVDIVKQRRDARRALGAAPVEPATLM